jgi:hypothetical protein
MEQNRQENGRVEGKCHKLNVLTAIQLYVLYRITLCKVKSTQWIVLVGQYLNISKRYSPTKTKLGHEWYQWPALTLLFRRLYIKYFYI